MRIHWEESATTKTAPFRRNPLGAGGAPTYQTEAAGAPQAVSGIGKAGHGEKTSLRSLLRACNPKTPARGPRDFCHGLLARMFHQSGNRGELGNKNRFPGHLGSDQA